MKKLIVYLGLAFVAVTNNANAENTLVEGLTANHLTVAAVRAEQYENLLTESADKGKFSPVEDKTVLNPETVVTVNNERTIEEIIAENNKIIESTIVNDGILFFMERPTEEIITEDNKTIDSNITTEIRPLYLERTIEDVIAEDNAIIEGGIPNEVSGLDLNKINNSIINKQAVGLNE